MAPTPTKVYIVRHGERLDHVSKSWQANPAHGISNPPLSSLGHQQAEKTGNYLCELIQNKNKSSMNHHQPTIMFYTSPFQRCIDTTISMIKGMQPFIHPQQPPIIRLELGLSEWMSDQFYDQVHCWGPNFFQGINYPSFTTHLNFPESYTDMLERFNNTRLHCLKHAHYQLPRNYCNVVPSSIIVIMVTHAIGVNALLDAFRDTITRPIKTNYCCISSLEYKTIQSSITSPPSPPSHHKEELADEEDHEDAWLESSICNNNYISQQKWVLDLTASDLHLSSIST
ncbi:unnamed protein product [Cunninghamella blakesleeana]